MYLKAYGLVTKHILVSSHKYQTTLNRSFHVYIGISGLCHHAKCCNDAKCYTITTFCVECQMLYKPEDHWSCIAHLLAEDMLKSAVIEEKKFKNIECK